MNVNDLRTKYGREAGTALMMAETAAWQMNIASETLDVSPTFDRVRVDLLKAIDAVRELETRKGEK